MTLIDLAVENGKRKVIPLMGFPGIQLTGYSIRQITFNYGLQIDTLRALCQRFRPDGMFFVMDLSIEAGALGLPVRHPLNDSPSVEDHPVRQSSDLEPYKDVDILKDGRVMVFLETMRQMKHTINVPCGGYVIGPFSLAGRLMGESEAAMASITDPDFLEEVLEFCTERIIEYGRALVQAGADMIAVLEPTGVILSPQDFTRFSGRYLQRIFAEIDAIGILHICGDTTHIIPAMCATGAQGLSLDSAVNLANVMRKVPENVVVMGNVDPVRVLGQMEPQEVRKEVKRLLEEMSDYPNFILSTGCDLPPETPLQNISAMVEACR